MRLHLLPALTALLATPLLAWQAPTQHELAALQGEEPQATILQCGLPQVPSREEALRSGWRYEVERAAMKRALMFRTSRAKADRGRVFPETNAATARLARRWGAPEAFCSLLELQAGGNLSRRQEYAAEQALRLLVADTYGIDTLQMRLLSENLNLPSAQHLAFVLQLPIGGMFDLVSSRLPAPARVLGDIVTMTSVQRRANDILLTVRDARSADAAAARLQELLPEWNTTLPTRYHRAELGPKLDSASQWAAQLLERNSESLFQTRRALHEKGWYGCPGLEAVDELLR